MNPEQQRICIAGTCGWKRFPIIPEPTDGHCLSPPPIGQWHKELPDFLSDLNAMHEAEKTLKTDQAISDYDTHVCTIVMRDWEVSGLLLSSMDWHATAAQRAEAFLKCLNLWKDS